MSILIFPNELILNVAEHLSLKELNSLLRTNQRLAYLLTPLLHRNAIKPIGECPALCWAATKGHEPLVRLLLANGMPIEVRDKETSMNALLLAASHGYGEIVQALLNAGASINSQEHYDGLTALHWAARAGHESIVQLLLEQGADVNSRDSLKSYLIRPHEYQSIHSPPKHVMGRDNTPLHWAAFGGYNSVVRVLLENGATVDPSNSLLDTPLIIAAAVASESTIRLLVDGRADLNSQNLRGWTALHWAARHGLETSVKLFLAEGANALLQDNGGLPPLGYARVCTEKPVRKLLWEHQFGTDQMASW